MAEMEDFVGLSYRGMPLAERVRIFDFGPSTAYLEFPAPMPVGTELIATSDSSLEIRVEVASIQEQVSGHDGPVGMRVRAVALEGAVEEWWSARKSVDDPAPKIVDGEVERAGDGPHRGDGTVELADDGKDTQSLNVQGEGGSGGGESAPEEAAPESAPEEAKAGADESAGDASADESAGDKDKKTKRRRSSKKAADKSGDSDQASDDGKKKRRGRKKKKT